MTDTYVKYHLKKNNFELNKVFNPEFLKLLEDEFEDKNIYFSHLVIFLINQGVDFNDDDAEAGEMIKIYKESIDELVNDDINIVSTNEEVLITFDGILDKI